MTAVRSRSLRGKLITLTLAFGLVGSLSGCSFTYDEAYGTVTSRSVEEIPVQFMPAGDNIKVIPATTEYELQVSYKNSEGVATEDAWDVTEEVYNECVDGSYFLRSEDGAIRCEATSFR
jgi:hypothetical protein